MKIELIKRTFEAVKYPHGSKERDLLNCKAETSEYMTSYKYIVRQHIPETAQNYPYTLDNSYRTKTEAQDAINLLQNATT